MTLATLDEILDARERRVKDRQAMLDRHGVPVVSLTMNIAGPRKTSPLIYRAFLHGAREIERAVNALGLVGRRVNTDAVEYYALYAVDADKHKLKELAQGIEETSPIGRILDIDVVGRDGVGLSRSAPRGCIVCGKAGRACARSRAHSADEVYRVTAEMLDRGLMLLDADKIAALASASLIREVDTTPKPGLVDLSGNGSHRDMTPEAFYKSAAALLPYFRDCFLVGHESRALTGHEAFLRLRERGIRAEGEMLAATGGVNTHKGAVYSFGILLGALGRLWRADTPIAKLRDVLGEARQIASAAADEDLASADGSTAGTRYYLSHGVRGIRGEAQDGFPHVADVALPAYRYAERLGADPNEAGLYALLSLIASVEDTCLYKRGGVEGVRYAREAAERLLKRGGLPDAHDYSLLDGEFIRRNLSPGGCADLLALTYFALSLEAFDE